MSVRTSNVTTHRIALAALWLCLAIIFGATRPAQAASNPWHVEQTLPSLKTPLAYVLWVKSGTTNASGAYSGDTASIWTVDATGHQMAVSPTYGPYPGWKAFEVIPAFDGTLRMVWGMDSGTTSDGFRSIVSVWTLDGSGNRMSAGPNYGPYPGWHFIEAFPNPDGTSALYWGKSTYDSNNNVNGGQLSIWTVDSTGNRLTVSPTYGPYTGWYFRGGLPSFNQDGTSFVTWVNEGTYDSNNKYSGDQISIWKTDERGNRTSVGPTYGRYAGWQFQELYPAYDGTARLLWTRSGTYDNNDNYTGDTASVWTVDATGHQTTVSPNFGPYPGWTVDSIVAAPSSTSRLLWILPGSYDINGNYSGDKASVWSLNAADVETSVSPTYTSPGGTLDGLAVMSDGSERMPWEYGSSAASSYNSTEFSGWALDASNNRTATGPIYGPYY